jgi:flagellar biosynthesis protein FliR
MRRYNRRVAIVMSLYVAILLASVWLISNHDVPVGLRALLAVLTALPITGVFLALGRYLIEEDDEYLRVLMIRQMLLGTGLAMAACTAWGFLEAFGVVVHVPLYWASIAWFGGFGLAGVVRRFLG